MEAISGVHVYAFIQVLTNCTHVVNNHNSHSEQLAQKAES